MLAALPPGTEVTAEACSGIAHVALPDAGALPALRTALLPHDGSAVVLSAPAQLRPALEHWGPLGDAVALMQRVKDRFDPDRRLAPGRFVGGI